MKTGKRVIVPIVIVEKENIKKAMTFLGGYVNVVVLTM